MNARAVAVSLALLLSACAAETIEPPPGNPGRYCPEEGVPCAEGYFALCEVQPEGWPLTHSEPQECEELVRDDECWRYEEYLVCVRP